MLEHRTRRDRKPRTARPAHQLDRDDAVAAKLEEVVVEPDTPDTQNLAIELAQDRLDRRPRRTIPAPQAKLRLRQRTTVQLAVRRQRQPIKLDQRRRHHVLRQLTRQRRPKSTNIKRPTTTEAAAPEASPEPPRPDLPRKSLPLRAALNGARAPRNHIPHQTLRPDRPTAQSPQPAQHPPAEPAPLRSRQARSGTREASPAHPRAPKLQHAIRTPPRQVPRPVHPPARVPVQLTMRVRDKPLRRQSKTTQITPRKTNTRNVKLPNNPNRNSLQPAVQNINTIPR